MGSAGEFDIRVRILEITKVTEYVYTTQEANKAGVNGIGTLNIDLNLRFEHFYSRGSLWSRT